MPRFHVHQPVRPIGYTYNVWPDSKRGRFVINWVGRSMEITVNLPTGLTSNLAYAHRFAQHFENLYIRRRAAGTEA